MEWKVPGNVETIGHLRPATMRNLVTQTFSAFFPPILSVQLMQRLIFVYFSPLCQFLISPSSNFLINPLNFSLLFFFLSFFLFLQFQLPYPLSFHLLFFHLSTLSLHFINILILIIFCLRFFLSFFLSLHFQLPHPVSQLHLLFFFQLVLSTYIY